MPLSPRARTILTVLVATLGYFVDVADLQLFSVVRVQSLQDLGLSPDAITSAGVTILNWQMTGLVLGGFLWGMGADKIGRVRILFGSILLYSLASLACAHVQTVPVYAVLRFLAGLGLAGEVGVAVTLLSEILSPARRTWGIIILIVIGVVGASTAAILAKLIEWRTLYLIGGIAGLVLLALRVGVQESGLFHNVRAESSLTRGALRKLWGTRERIGRYVACVALGAPIWYVVGILAVFAPEVAVNLGSPDKVTAPDAVLFAALGMCLGDFLAGLLSQIFKNRRKVMAAFLACGLILNVVLLNAYGISARQYYALLFICCVFNGYFLVFLAITAESFGTNLRATATTSVSNLMRAFIIPITLLVMALKPHLGFLDAALVTAVPVYLLAFTGLAFLRETYGRDLDFTEK